MSTSIITLCEGRRSRPIMKRHRRLSQQVGATARRHRRWIQRCGRNKLPALVIGGGRQRDIIRREWCAARWRRSWWGIGKDHRRLRRHLHQQQQKNQRSHVASKRTVNVFKNCFLNKEGSKEQNQNSDHMIKIPIMIDLSDTTVLQHKR